MHGQPALCIVPVGLVVLHQLLHGLTHMHALSHEHTVHVVVDDSASSVKQAGFALMLNQPNQ